MNSTLIDVPTGLRNVAVTDTTIGDVRGDEGFYHYRQYSAIDLAHNCTLEEVWFLLFKGRLPNAKELERFRSQVAPLMVIPAQVAEALPAITKTQHKHAGALDGLRSAISLAASAWGMRPWLDLDSTAQKHDALALCAMVPTLLTALHRLHQGLPVIPPREGLNYASNYLYMMLGNIPATDEARAVEHYLISTIDHGFNASTFTARVIASTGADLGACVAGAIGALSGPLHGGAPSRALETLDAIGKAELAAPWVRQKVLAGERMMGFGHAVYRTEDPRSAMLKRIAQQLGGSRVNDAIAIEQEIIDTLADVKPGRQLHTNVEYYAGVVMERCGIPAQMFTPTFAASRVIGWCSNILEQAADNKIIRPAARYVGAAPAQPVPAMAAR